MTRLLAFAAVVLLLATGAATAVPLVPTSYDMFNGNGQASGGSFNYWDKNYTGMGATTVDNARLWGGLGDLTDGVIPTLNWFAVENAAGTGPYVGWRGSRLPRPTVTFRFGSSVVLDSLRVYVDDSNGAGGVTVPLQVGIGVEGGPYTYFNLVDVPASVPVDYLVPGLGLTGTAFDVQFVHRTDWLFVSEVTFDGRSSAPAVPEPGSMILLGTGLVGLGRAWRKRRG